MPRFLLAVATLLAGCATLGPTPATLGVSAIPTDRPSGELQVGALPGYFLSQAVVEEPHSEPLSQATLVIDPAKIAGDTGFVLGGRLVGPSHDTQVEPMLGVRRALGAERRVSIAGFLSGTRAQATDDRASYEATRGAAEIAVDVQVTEPSRWLELHLVGGASATYLDARGSYCLDASGRYGVDCGDTDPLMDTEVSGVYPAATAGIALHALRDKGSVFHGVRAIAVFSAGAMPRVVEALQTDGVGFASAGLALSVAFGSRD